MNKFFKGWYLESPDRGYWYIQLSLAIVGLVLSGMDPTGLIGIVGLAFFCVALLGSAIAILGSLITATYHRIVQRKKF